MPLHCRIWYDASSSWASRERQEHSSEMVSTVMPRKLVLCVLTLTSNFTSPRRLTSTGMPPESRTSEMTSSVSMWHSSRSSGCRLAAPAAEICERMQCRPSASTMARRKSGFLASTERRSAASSMYRLPYPSMMWSSASKQYVSPMASAWCLRCASEMSATRTDGRTSASEVASSMTRVMWSSTSMSRRWYSGEWVAIFFTMDAASVRISLPYSTGSLR